jgi:hypothetical protein
VIFYLKVGNKVDITVICYDFSHPVGKFSCETFVDLEPSCVKAQAEWSTVGSIMPNK